MGKNYKNSYKVSEKELVSLSVYNVGYQKCEQNYQWGPGIRDHYLIHYIISGKGTYIANGKEYSLSAGDAFLVFPNSIVTYKSDSSAPWEYTWVGFAGSDAPTILQSTDFTKESPFIRQLENGEEIKRNILSIYDSRGNNFESAVAMTGKLYTLLSSLLKISSKKICTNNNVSYVQKAIEFISENYSYPITIEDVATYVGLSRSHLFRTFQTVLNVSPKEYLTDFRIKQACNLIENTDLTFTAIANSIGFDNSLYFSKTFHKRKGLSPMEYKKKLRG
ncbi:transcriptional regulator, AraC family [Lachnospiraceae bacterium C7]|nr:transcriptional regulator, AraC family [Lachnospiraceae bacterium C7]